MQYLIQHTRLTLSGKNNERYLTAQSKTITAQQGMTKGSTFVVIEILNQWFSGSQIGQSIINALNREYQRVSNSSDLVNFELSLKKVNETLARLTQNGETDWLGKLNACLVLICDNQLHLAQIGKTEAYLIRNGEISPIAEGLEQNSELHPLKTFHDIISGSLKTHDKIIITTPLLFDYFSRENLKQIIANNDTYAAVQEIANRLKREKEKKVAAIILELISKEEALTASQEENTQVVYLDQGSNLPSIHLEVKEFFQDLQPSLEKLKASSQQFGKNLRKISIALAPQIAKLITSIKKLIKQAYHHFGTKILPQVQNSLKPVTQKIRQTTRQTLTKNQFIAKNLQIHHYTQISKNSKLFPVLAKAKSWGQKSLVKLQDGLGWLFDPKNRALFYGILVIILSLILIFSINNLRSKQNQKQQKETINQILNEAQNQFTDKYKLALLYNDKIQAKEILTDIIVKTSSIQSDDQSIMAQVKQLTNQAQDELDKLNNVQRIKNLESVVEFAQADLLANSHDYLFAITKGGKNLSFSTKTNAQQENSNVSAIQGNWLTLAASEEADLIYLLTDQNQVYKLANPLQAPSELKPKEGDWKTGVSMEVFAGNIYILDSNGNQIWKFNQDAAGFSNAQSFLASGVEIGDGLDLAIDGVIYVLKKNGQIIKLSKGRQQDFRLKDIPKPDDQLNNPKRIYTNADANYIYVLDGNRLLELEKSGTFVAQYIFAGLNDLKDFSLNPKTREIWLLDGNKIYKGNL